MPLSKPASRREIHQRIIEVGAFARDDGLYDIEARLLDRKPFAFWRPQKSDPVPAGDPLHNLWIRLTIDAQYVVRAIEAASDTTPFELCREAEATLSILIGERIASGWSSRVKGALRGAASCTHLMEMLIAMATPALQGIRGLVGQHGLRSDTTAIAGKLDSCYSYSRHRAVVKLYWPEHYRAPKTPEA